MTVPGSSLGTEIWESSSQGKSWVLRLSFLAHSHPLGLGSLVGEHPALGPQMHVELYLSLASSPGPHC